MANILSLLKKDDTAQAKPNAPKISSVDSQEFLPFYGHFSPHTLITKNGELLQTIRITANSHGLNYERNDTDQTTLRDLLRASLSAQIQSDEYAIWIHTIRKRRKVTLEERFSNDFASKVNQHWRKQHDWTHHYYNEVYITLIHDAQRATLFDKEQMRYASTQKQNRALRNNYLEAVEQELSFVTDSVIEDLKTAYQVSKLGVVERTYRDAECPTETPVFYSEPLEFFSYLLNLRHTEIPLPEADFSAAAQRSDLLFGYNALETKHSDGGKRFAAILSLKQYREAPARAMDILLQAPVEMIFSQAFHFIPHTIALKEYREQKELFEISGDTYSLKASGLVEMFSAHQKKPTDFGHQQTNCVILVDDFKRLETDTNYIQKAFGDLGLIAIREDIRLEEAFWSLFPANFEFLSRRAPIGTPHTAGFVRLNRFASGKHDATHWGSPVAILPTTVNSPYFFNFHVQDNGHTLWLDFNSFNDAMGRSALFFLLTQTQKMRAKLLLFDHSNSASLWFDKMKAPYYTLSTQAEKTTTQLKLNPFSLENNGRNLSFLLAWVIELIRPETALLEHEIEAIRQAIAAVYDQPAAKRSLQTFLQQLAATQPQLAKRCSPWNAGGAYQFVFSADEDTVTVQHAMQAFQLMPEIYEEKCIIPVFSYLLHRIILSLTGEPTIIVLQDAEALLGQPFFLMRLESLMTMFKERNAMIIFNIRQPHAILQSPLISLLNEQCATKVVVPDDIPTDYVSLSSAMFTSADQSLISNMARMKGDIFIKQTNETVAVRINLDTMPDIFAIYGNDIKSLIAAGGEFSSLPKAGGYA